ncbi:AcrR family transcriptional regulator [Deinococcus metalli]|uniref:AcrR family transcriptional regulator n=2 Tax=Deinococcus metalli TaxID=1141878 RepID=A0A7W8KCL9_9DEIO|nr:TetR/AcrR family transcriptional regulator [Deinococcus metalli]MBB5375737.1 AcrR family transcriptional regulator [Deinococcus metalli]
MGRWGPDARGRLERAAMELYEERGYEQTTVAEIAARAGLTERTFFRHFTDKREVLFGGAGILQERVVTGVLDASASATPLQAVMAALNHAGRLFGETPTRSRQRQRIIDATPELQARELSKLSTVAGATADALRQRGVPDPAATLTAEVGIVAFRTAFGHWISDPAERPWSDHLHEALDGLHAVMTGR